MLLSKKRVKDRKRWLEEEGDRVEAACWSEMPAYTRENRISCSDKLIFWSRL